MENGGISEPLLSNTVEKEQDEDQEFEEDSGETEKPVTSIMAAYKLLTPSVKVRKNRAS